MGFLLLLKVRGAGAWRRKLGLCLIGCSALWFYVWSTSLFTQIVGGVLEDGYMVDGRWPGVHDFPSCDVIVDMGGGVGASSERSSHVYLNSSADRAYFSALLWKSGKAPIVMPSGTGLVNADRKFLLDLGVPDSAIMVENEARNTEENAKFVGELLVRHVQDRSRKRLW